MNHLYKQLKHTLHSKKDSDQLKVIAVLYTIDLVLVYILCKVWGFIR